MTLPLAEKLALTPDEVVALTGISRSEVMAAIHRGELAAKMRGRFYLITRKAIEAYLDALPSA